MIKFKILEIQIKNKYIRNKIPIINLFNTIKFINKTIIYEFSIYEQKKKFINGINNSLIVDRIKYD